MTGTDALWGFELLRPAQTSLAALADLPDEFQAVLLLGTPLRRGSLGSGRPLDRHAADRRLSVGGSEQPRSTAQ